ncbi:MAG: EthD family reductase [Actinomycetota bacterium]|nr:EthD family reductase [Actinomycetota bacterium]
MVKVIFVLHRREGVTREESSRRWSGEQHTSLVGALPGLVKWIQNHVTGAEDAACDGIGELWFQSVEALDKALSSPQMQAAVENSKEFLDMDKTYMVVVEERSILQ